MTDFLAQKKQTGGQLECTLYRPISDIDYIINIILYYQPATEAEYNENGVPILDAIPESIEILHTLYYTDPAYILDLNVAMQDVELEVLVLEQKDKWFY